MKLRQPSNNQWFLITTLILIVTVTHSSNSFDQNRQNTSTAETLGVTGNALLRRSINQHGNYGQIKLSEDLNQTLTDVVDGLTDAIDITSQYNNVDFLEEAQQIMNRLKQHIMDNIMSLQQNQNKTTNISDNARRGLTSYWSDYDTGIHPSVASGKRARAGTIDYCSRENIKKLSPTQFDNCAKRFLQKIIDSGECHQQFKNIIKDGKKACKNVFGSTAFITCKKNHYRIRPFIPAADWKTKVVKRCTSGQSANAPVVNQKNCCKKTKSVNAKNCCKPGKSANAPVPIVIAHIDAAGQEKQSFPYFIKKQEQWGPANDYLAMKVAKWLNEIFTEIYPTDHEQDRPIIKVFDIVPSFKPKSQCDPKWKFANVKKMYFFPIFETRYKGGWIDNAEKPEDHQHWYEKNSAYPYFNAFDPKKKEHKCECGQHLKTMLRSLRGAFIIQMLLGAKDRHAENVGITKDCVVMNIDYGHFLAGKTTTYHHVSMYNDYLQKYLQQIKMEDTFIHDLQNDLTKLRNYFTGTNSEWRDFTKLTEKEKNYICNKFYEFKTTQFDHPWEADQWISMTTAGYKIHHKQPLDKYMMYTLFGNENTGKHQPKIKYKNEDDLKNMMKSDMAAINYKMKEKHVAHDRSASDIYDKKKAKKHGYEIPDTAKCPSS